MSISYRKCHKTKNIIEKATDSRISEKFFFCIDSRFLLNL